MINEMITGRLAFFIGKQLFEGFHGHEETDLVAGGCDIDADNFSVMPDGRPAAHAGIETRVRNAYQKWVKEKGNIFRLRDGVDSHHDTIKLRWEMLPKGRGEVISIGCDFLLLSGDGRIRTGYQFIEV